MNQQDSGKSRTGLPRTDRGQPEKGQEQPHATPGHSQPAPGQQRQDRSGERYQQRAVPDTNVNTAHTGYPYDDERDDEGYLRDSRDEERMEEEEVEEAH